MYTTDRERSRQGCLSPSDTADRGQRRFIALPEPAPRKTKCMTLHIEHYRVLGMYCDARKITQHIASTQWRRKELRDRENHDDDGRAMPTLDDLILFTPRFWIVAASALHLYRPMRQHLKDLAIGRGTEYGFTGCRWDDMLRHPCKGEDGVC
jgi:hypothetical protein